MVIGVNEPGYDPECRDLWCDYGYWGACKHTYTERILNGYFQEYIILFMVLVPLIGLIGVIANLTVSRYYATRPDPISSLYQLICYVNIITAIASFLHTGSYFTFSMPCNSQPPEQKMSENWLRFQILTNLLTILVARITPFLVAMVAVVRVLEVYGKRTVNFRVPVLIGLLWILGWTGGLAYLIQFRRSAGNIFMPALAVAERESPLWAHLSFLLLDYTPLAVLSVPTLLCVSLVGVAMRISGKGWGDREFERSSGVFQVGVLFLLSVVCQVVGMGGVMAVYMEPTFSLSYGYIPTYLLSTVSLFLAATLFPLLAFRWDRRLRGWLSAKPDHTYDTVSYYSLGSAKTDVSTTWSFARSLRSKLSSYRVGSLSTRTDRSTVYDPALSRPPSTFAPSETTRTDRSSGLPSPSATTWSMPPTAHTDYSTAPPSSVLSEQGATRASSWTDRTDRSSYRPPSVTPPTTPPPPLTPGITDRTSPPKTIPVSSRATATPPREDTGRREMLEQRRREMGEMRAERERLLAEYRSNVELLSEVSSAVSSRRSGGGERRRKKRSATRSDTRSAPSDLSSTLGSDLYTVYEISLPSDLSPSETDATSGITTRSKTSAALSDMTVSATDWSSGAPSITAPTSTVSEEFGDPTDASSGLSVLSRLAEEPSESVSEWDASTTVPYAKKY